MRMYGMSHQNDPKLWLKEDSRVLLLLLSLFLLMITAYTFREIRNPFSFFWPIDEHESEQPIFGCLLNDNSVSFYVHKNVFISLDMHIIITHKWCHTDNLFNWSDGCIDNTSKFWSVELSHDETMCQESHFRRIHFH